jgi:hypothetical protein
MSGLGHERHFSQVRDESAYRPIADMPLSAANGREGPKAAVSGLAGGHRLLSVSQCVDRFMVARSCDC